MKATLFIPVLNEIEGLKAMMPQIDLSWVEEILFVDGGSTDGSIEYARQYAAEHTGRTKVHVMTQKSKGLTGAYDDAIPAASGDIMVAFSPDGNSIPGLIPQLTGKIKEGYDMAIASRYLSGAKSEDDDAVTAFGNWLFTAMINLLFGARYTDSLVMLRAWRREIIGKSSGVARAGFDPFLSIWCAKKKLKVAEIPGDEPKRIGGVRKMNPLLNGLAILQLMAEQLLH